MRWGQGKEFAFKRGDTVWDKPTHHLDWSDAMKIVTLGGQVIDAKPAGWVPLETISTAEKSVKIISQPVELTKVGNPRKATETDEKDGLVLDRMRWDGGYIKFQVLRPSKDRSNMFKDEIIETTQTDFVAFLQSGVVYPLIGKGIDLLGGTQ